MLKKAISYSDKTSYGGGGGGGFVVVVVFLGGGEGLSASGAQFV